MILSARQLYSVYIFLQGLDELTARTGVVALAAGSEYMELDGDLLKVRAIRRPKVDLQSGAPVDGETTVTYAVDTSD